MSTTPKRGQDDRTTEESWNLEQLNTIFEDAGLTTKQKQAAWYLIGEDLSTREAAKRMGCSQPTVVQHFDYACRKLPALRARYGVLVGLRTRTAKTAGRTKRLAA
jgi:DNA-directed RNA polymerase specialized sigma24 family protein